MIFFEILAAASLMNLAVGALIVLAMCASVMYDHRNESYWRWVILASAVGTFVGMSGFSFAQSSIKDSLLSILGNASVWSAVGAYICIGIVYSIAEFGMTVRRSANKLSEAWSKWVAGTTQSKEANSLRITRREVYEDVAKNGEQSEYFGVAKKMNVEFINTNNWYRDVIGLCETEDRLAIEPRVNRNRLAAAIGDWVTFWPFFLLNFLLYDMLSELWNAIATFLATYSQRFVKAVFSDVFKIG